MLWMIAFLGLLFGGIFGFQAFKNKMMAAHFATFQPPPATVSAAHAEALIWHPVLNSIGTVKAIQGVRVSSESAGIIREIRFQAGDQVNKGDLLVQLDDSEDRARLRGLQAELALAKANYERERKLIEQHAVSRGDFDTREATLRNAEAQVASMEAAIAKKAIRAPFTGTLGMRLVNLGGYLAPGAPIVELQTLNPVWIEFSLPEQMLRQTSLGQTVRARADALPEQALEGKITAIDMKINEATRNVLLQATLDNPENRLLPGMFAQVEVILPVQENVVTVPITALEYNLYGDSVFLIKETGKDEKNQPILTVTRQSVVPGEQRGDRVAIREGLQAGDWIVTSGQLKLQNGSRVAIDENAKL